MTTLTSVKSERVKAVHALTRRAGRSTARLFLAEGPQAVREAVRFRPEAVVDLYVDPAGHDRHREIVDAARQADVRVTDVSAEVLAAMGDTQAPQGLIAVCRFLDVPLASVLAGEPRLLVMLTHVRDPGNAGTVLRGADAVGADAVILSRESVDLYNPKVVRSTVGSLFHLPVVTGVDVSDGLAAIRQAGIRTLAADGSGHALLDDDEVTTHLRGRHAWVMGNEAWGMDEATRSACDDVVRLPIHGHAESLNLAMAATVCLYSSARLQRGPGGIAHSA